MSEVLKGYTYHHRSRDRKNGAPRIHGVVKIRGKDPGDRVRGHIYNRSKKGNKTSVPSFDSEPTLPRYLRPLRQTGPSRVWWVLLFRLGGTGPFRCLPSTSVPVSDSVFRTPDDYPDRDGPTLVVLPPSSTPTINGSEDGPSGPTSPLHLPYEGEGPGGPLPYERTRTSRLFRPSPVTVRSRMGHREEWSQRESRSKGDVPLCLYRRHSFRSSVFPCPFFLPPFSRPFPSL